MNFPAIASIVLYLCSAVVAPAQITTLRYYMDANGQRCWEETDTDVLSPAAGDQVYDNWRGPVTGGRTRFPIGTSEYQTGTAEIGDDLQLINNGPGRVTDIGFTYLNASATNVITSFTWNIRFYNQNFEQVGIDIYTLNLGLQPRAGVKVFSDGYFYYPFNIPTSQQMYMSIQFTDIVGAGPGDMGMLVGGPITTGNSSQYLRNFTTGELIDMGTTSQRNLGFFIDSVSVPAPTVLLASCIALPIALRRRR